MLIVVGKHQISTHHFFFRSVPFISANVFFFSWKYTNRDTHQSCWANERRIYSPSPKKTKNLHERTPNTIFHVSCCLMRAQKQQQQQRKIYHASCIMYIMAAAFYLCAHIRTQRLGEEAFVQIVYTSYIYVKYKVVLLCACQMSQFQENKQ